MARVSIEDCLTNIENRFVLVAVASHRTRRLMSGAEPLVNSKNKEAVTALREIAEGRVLPQAPTPPPETAADSANSDAKEATAVKNSVATVTEDAATDSVDQAKE